MSYTVGGLGEFEETAIKRFSVMVESNDGWPVFLAWLEAWRDEARDALETREDIDERDAIAKIRVLRKIIDDVKILPDVLSKKLATIEAERKTVGKG